MSDICQLTASAQCDLLTLLHIYGGYEGDEEMLEKILDEPVTPEILELHQAAEREQKFLGEVEGTGDHEGLQLAIITLSPLPELWAKDYTSASVTLAQ
jgi:hypothetical protein